MNYNNCGDPVMFYVAPLLGQTDVQYLGFPDRKKLSKCTPGKVMTSMASKYLQNYIPSVSPYS